MLAFNSVFQDAQGNGKALATIKVYLSGPEPRTLATIYRLDGSAVNQTTNPIKTNVRGQYGFRCADALLDIEGAALSGETFMLTGVEHYEVIPKLQTIDISRDTAVAAAASAGALVKWAKADLTNEQLQTLALKSVVRFARDETQGNFTTEYPVVDAGGGVRALGTPKIIDLDLLRSELGDPTVGSGADRVANAVRTLPDLAALRAYPKPAIITNRTYGAVTLCRSSEDDGGGGTWDWLPYSNRVDNDVTVIRPAGSTSSGRWVRRSDTPGVIDPRWAGAIFDGVTDDRVALQRALAALPAPGGVVRWPQGRVTAFIGAAAGTKSFYGYSRKFSLELMPGQFMDLSDGTLIGAPNSDYVLVSNKNTQASGAGTNTDHTLGIYGGTIDANYKPANGVSASTAPAVSFYGVRSLRFGSYLRIINALNIALDWELVDDVAFGVLRFEDIWGQAYYSGGNGSIGGGPVTNVNGRSIICRNIHAHPTNGGLPGNPLLLTGDKGSIESIDCENCAGGVKGISLSNYQIRSARFVGGALSTVNSGWKLQGGDDTSQCKNVTVIDLNVQDCAGPGLYATFCVGCTINNYTGLNNGKSGIHADAYYAATGLTILNFSSDGAGDRAIYQSDDNSTLLTGAPRVKFGKIAIRNPFSMTSPATASAIYVNDGDFAAEDVSVVDDRANPRTIRIIDSSRAKNCSISIGKLHSRGVAGGALLQGLRKGQISNPDIGMYTFPALSVSLGTVAISAGVAANASSAVFSATDVGMLLYSTAGGVAQITAVSDTYTATVSILAAFGSGTGAKTLASGEWYLDRNSGGAGVFTLAAGATSTAVADQNNIGSGGYAQVQITPLNAAARTLGYTGYTFTGSTLTLRHLAATGGEQYAYRVTGWTTSAAVLS